MWFARIEAITVGPLEGLAVDLAPGLNVVHGPNESGKSSWHAALIAGWLGTRRGRGQARVDDRRFVERHTPWSGAPFVAAVTCVTGDGRHIRIRHNLTELADNDAVDDLGRDLSGELERDGTVDGAALLGVTRQIARAALIVAQNDAAPVDAAAPGLLAHLQRSISSGDTHGATTTAALDRIAEFRRIQVGTARQSTRPKAVAADRFDEARRRLDRAREQHQEHLSRLAEHRRGHAQLATLEQRLATLRAAEAAARRDRLADELEHLRAHGGTSVDVDVTAADPAAGTTVDPTTGPDDARSALSRARDRLDAHRRLPVASADDETMRMSADELEELASVLDPIVDESGTDAQIARLRDELRPKGIARAAPTLIGAAAAAGLGAAALAVLDRPTAAAAVGGCALLVAAIAILARLRSRPPSELRTRLQRLEARSAHRHTDRLAAEIAQRTARDQLRAAGVTTTEPDRLRTLAQQRRELDRHPVDEDAWRERLESLESEVGAARNRLVAALEHALTLASEEARGHTTPDDPAVVRHQLSALDDELRETRLRLERIDAVIELDGDVDEELAEATEELARAREALDRIERLDHLLEVAADHLRAADDRVNRDIAPVLRDGVKAHLPHVTGGRYHDVMVDPRSLEVRVRTSHGAFRPAADLSHGTTVQLGLLLRVALAQYLVADTAAPLVFDDATVQFDDDRTAAFLDLCLELARERQIVLFTQETAVLGWARQHLIDDAHRLIRLPEPPVPAA